MNAKRVGDKRADTIEGALVVFARDGYSRASIDAIAAEAGVSTRTLYKYFNDKADLFGAVIEHSATSVATEQIAAMRRHLHNATDLEAALTAFALEWVSSIPAGSAHAALLRHVDADAKHLPRKVLLAWRDAGPMRVLNELAAQFSGLAAVGALHIDDPVEAALHFAALINAAPPGAQWLPSERSTRSERVTRAVHVFLHGYQAAQPARDPRHRSIATAASSQTRP